MEVRLIRMAGIEVAEAPVLLKTTLGSCVGVVLHDRGRSVGGLAHVMLPRRLGQDRSVGKYADTAVPALVERMRRFGSERRDLSAFLAGGANMFRQAADGAIATIGAHNIEAVRQILADLRIPIAFEDIGGTQGRTVIFDSARGALDVRKLQQIEVRRVTA